jgi:hypothetical protein
MKKIFALALIASSSVAFASDSAIYDIQYLPSAGTSYGFSEFSYEKRMVDADGDVDINGWRLSQTLGHSFTDRLSIQADLNYLNARWDNEDFENTNQNGLSDLNLNARYRLIDEAIRLDIIGGGQLALGDGDGNGSVNNRYFTGGNKLNVGVQVGEKSENFQWSVLGRYIHSFERTIDFAGDTDIDPQEAVQARADLLNKLAEKSYLRSHFTADFIQATEFKDGGSFFGPQSNYEIGTEYQHLCSQDLMARIGVDYVMRHYDSAQYDSDNSLNFKIAANYQF